MEKLITKLMMAKLIANFIAKLIGSQWKRS